MAAFFTGIAALVGTLYCKAIHWGPDTLAVLTPQIGGDYSLHIGYISSFVWGDNLPPRDNPILAGRPLQYPLMADFLSALLIRGGAGLAEAITWPSLWLALAFFGWLFALQCQLTHKPRAAALAVVLFLFAGGLGAFMHLGADWKAAGRPWLDFLWHLPDYYTYRGSLQWNNPLVFTLLPQRAFLLGFPIALAVFSLCLKGLDLPAGQGRPEFLAAGFLAGSSLLFHAHSFAVIHGACAAWFLLFRERRARYFYLAALPLLIPQVWLLHGQVQGATSLFYFQWGWLARGEPVWLFWLKNAGLFPLLALGGGVWLWLRDRRCLLLCAPFLLLFALCNLFILSPAEWDNSKYLLYGFIFALAPAALALDNLWRQPAAFKALAGVLMFTLCLSGALDQFQLLVRPASRYLVLWDREDVELAEWIRAHVPARARFLARPVKNSPVLLAGRRLIMGDPYHLYSHGTGHLIPLLIDWQDMLEGEARAASLLATYQVDYVLLDPATVAEFNADKPFFDQYFPIVFRSRHYLIYAIRHPNRPLPASSKTPKIVNPLPPSGKELKPGLQFRAWDAAGRLLAAATSHPWDFEYHHAGQKPYVTPFMMEWQGFLAISTPGDYTVRLLSDDGSTLHLGEALLIDNWSVHELRGKSAHIRLTGAGLYPLKLRYFDAGGRAGLFWVLRDNQGQPVPLAGNLFSL